VTTDADVDFSVTKYQDANQADSILKIQKELDEYVSNPCVPHSLVSQAKDVVDRGQRD